MSETLLDRRHMMIGSEMYDPSLIFFAPMTRGDLTDHISKNSLQNYSSFVSWSESKQLYYVIKTTSKSNYAYWNVDFSSVLPRVSDQPFTFVVDGQSVMMSSYNLPEFFTLGDYANSPINWVPYISVDGWHEASSVKTAFIRRSTVFDGRYKLRYTGNVLTEKADVDTSSAWRVSNWQDQSFQRVCLNPFSEENERGMDIYVKNLRIYNRALSIEEIMELPE